MHISLFFEAKVLPNQKNVTVPKGFPYKLGCTSWGPPELYHVIWMKEGKFIDNDDHYDISSSKQSKNSQNHELIVHSANISTIYKCALINTTGSIVDSVELHVSVEGTYYNDTLVAIILYSCIPTQ